MQEVYVNGSEFDSAQEILEYLRDEIGLDALTAVSDDTKITMDMSGVTDDELLDAMERMSEIMGDAADDSDYLEITCIE